MKKYEQITRVVAEHFAVDYDSLFTRSRLQHIAAARQWSMFFAIRTLNLKLVQVADFFDRDHATAIHANKVVSNEIEMTARGRNIYKELKLKLSQQGIKSDYTPINPSDFRFGGKRVDNGEWIEGYILKAFGAVHICPDAFFTSVIFHDDDTTFDAETDGVVFGGFFEVDPETISFYKK